MKQAGVATLVSDQIDVKPNLVSEEMRRVTFY